MDNLVSQIEINSFKKDGAVLIKAKFDNTWIKKLKEGIKKAKNVKVSVDGGKSWKKAKFIGPDLGKFAWRQFALETTLSAGTYTLSSKASNGSDTQPELRMENRRGYEHNGWKDHSVKISVV